MKKSISMLSALIFVVTVCLSGASAQTVVSGGILNARALKLPAPSYPAAAKAVRATGQVNVQVLVDEEGNVVEAQAVSGHPLLRQTSERAAKQAKFTPVRIEGKLMKMTGVIIYNFTGAASWQETGFLLGAFEKGLTDFDQEFEELPSRLPAELADEKTKLEAVARHRKDNPKADQTEQITGILDSIQFKLSDKKIEAWMFRLGLLKGRLRGSLDDDAKLAKNLKEAKILLETRPAGIAENLTKQLQELSAYADNATFSQADRERIREISSLYF